MKKWTPALLALALISGLVYFGTTRSDIDVLGSSQNHAAGSRVGGGCIGECKPLGYTDLNGQSNVVLENVHISNPNGRCLTIDNARNITIRNSVIGPCGTDRAVQDGYETGLITVRNSNNIRFEANWVEDISSKEFGHLRNNAFWITDSPNVTFIDNTIRDVHSDITQKFHNKGNRAIAVNGGSPNFKVVHNTFYNAGRDAVQYRHNFNVEGVEISYNRMEGRGPFDSDYEDIVNLYGSTGTPSSPIMVKGNFFRNGSPSSTGTGIIVGDGNTTIGTNAHIVVTENVFYNPGHVGIGVAGGAYIEVSNNKIYSAAYDHMPATSVGMYVNHQPYGPNCHNITISNNEISYATVHLARGTNHIWNSGNCPGATLVNNTLGGDLSGIWTLGPAAPKRTPNDSVAPTTAAPTTAAPTTAAPTTAAPTTAAPTTAAPTTAAPTTAAQTSTTVDSKKQTSSSTSAATTSSSNKSQAKPSSTSAPAGSESAKRTGNSAPKAAPTLGQSESNFVEAPAAATAETTGQAALVEPQAETNDQASSDDPTSQTQSASASRSNDANRQADTAEVSSPASETTSASADDAESGSEVSEGESPVSPTLVDEEAALPQPGTPDRDGMTIGLAVPFALVLLCLGLAAAALRPRQS